MTGAVVGTGVDQKTKSYSTERMPNVTIQSKRARADGPRRVAPRVEMPLPPERLGAMGDGLIQWDSDCPRVRHDYREGKRTSIAS